MSYFIVWEFEVRKGREKEFERMYGPHGEWARLFAKRNGYKGTHLLRGEGRRRWYVTIDRWVSRGAYQRFKTRLVDEYARMDARGEGLITKGRKIGEFNALGH